MRTNATYPKWDVQKNMWIYRPYVNGVQKKYTSRKPGPAGAAECKRSYSKAVGGLDTKTPRFEDAWNDYVQYRRDLMGDTESVSKTEQYGKYYLLPRLKNKRVGDITIIDWQKCIISARPVKKGLDRLSRKSLINIRGEITGFCKYAYDAQILDRIPQRLRIPKEAPVIGKNIIQPDTLVKFLLDDSDEWYLYAWQLMVVTGLRPGECYGLKKQDLSDGLIKVRRSMNHSRKLTPGKTKNAIRTIVQTRWSGKIIEKQLEKLMNNDIDSEWLFPTPAGARPCPSTITHHWSKYRQKFPEHITQHGLRHTFNSINKNLPEAWRKKYIGHSENMDTDGVYGHHVNGEDALIARSIDQNLADLLSKTSTKQVPEDGESPETLQPQGFPWSE